MSECHFWWKAGKVQWCDMTGESCNCGGWEENCDMKTRKGKKDKTRLVAQARSFALEDEFEEY